MQALNYQVGGSLAIHNQTYVVRQADHDLYQALLAREFCYVFNARQMGKSSLRLRVKHRLQTEGWACAGIDVTAIGSQSTTPQQWYKSIADQLLEDLNLLNQVDLKTWWQGKSDRSLVDRLRQLLKDILTIYRPNQSLCIFIDEIDSVLSLNFPIDDFFALIRFLYNQRAENPVYQRLTFALFGVATPSDLIQDLTRTPFNIGKAIELRGFQLQEAFPLAQGFEGFFNNPTAILAEILRWTGGQPFLTQKVCRLVIEKGSNREWENETGAIPLPNSLVESLVQSCIIHNWEAQDEPEHLKTIRDRLRRDERSSSRLLGLYQQVLRDSQEQNAKFRSPSITPVAVDESWEQTQLLLSGVVIKHQGFLRVRNRIYHSVFNLEWVNQQLTNLRPYGNDLRAWLASDRTDSSRLLHGKALQDAQQWADGKRLSDEDYQFLAASQQQQQQQWLEAVQAQETAARLVQEKKTARLQRYLLRVISLALIAAIGLAAVAFWQFQTAKISEIQALSRTSEALFVSDRNLDALVEALRNRQQLHRVAAVDADTKAQSDAVLRQAVYSAVEYNRLSGHQEFVYGVAISPDGQLIATASRDKTIKLWSSDGKLLHTLTGHEDWVQAVAFSPDGQILASCGNDGLVKLWQRNGRLLGTAVGNRSKTLYDITFSPDGQRIAAASEDGTVRLWQRDGQPIRTIQTNQEIVFGVAFHPTQAMLATAGRDRTVKLWNLEGELIKTLEGHQDKVLALAFSPDGQLLATAAADKTIKLWRSNGQLIRTISGHSVEIWGVTFSPDGQWLASTSGDKTIKIWNLEGALLMTLNQEEFAWKSAFSPDGTWLASAGSNNLVKLWRFHHPILTRLRGHQDWVFQVALHPDGQRLASANWDKTIKLWEIKGNLLTTFRNHQGRAVAVAFHPDGERIASGDEENLIKLWRADGKVLNTFSLTSPSTTPATANALREKAESGGIDFSPDGQLMVAGNSAIPEAKVWRLNGTLVATLSGHQKGITRVRFSPNGQLIASASWDGTVKLWTLDGNPGGPGGSGIDSLPTWFSQFPTKLPQRFDIISFDPRGIGNSTAVQCFDDADEQKSFFAKLPQGFPVGEAETKNWIQGYTRLGQLCQQKSGKLLAHVSTADVAKDMDLLRRAVGEPMFNYIGVSYGTILGAVYANLFPDKVRAMVLDGNVDPIAWNNGGKDRARLSISLRVGTDLGTAKTLKKFLELCGQTSIDRCAFSAGSAAATQARYAALLEKLRKQPVVINGQTITYAVLIYSLSGSLFTVQEFAGYRGWTGAALLLHKAWEAPAATSPDPSTIPVIEPDLGWFPVACADTLNPRNPQAYPQLAAFSFKRSGAVGPNAFWGDSACATWPAISADRYNGPWNRPTANPLLVIGNTYDPDTPYEGSVAMARELDRARLLTVDGYGHTAFLNPSQCANQYITNYFLNGQLPAKGTICKQDYQPFSPTSYKFYSKMHRTRSRVTVDASMARPFEQVHYNEPRAYTQALSHRLSETR